MSLSLTSSGAATSLKELGYPQRRINIYEDNQSCITMLQQEPRSFHTKSRHVRVKWAFYREEYKKGTVKLRYRPTKDMLADLLTKPLGGKLHTLHASRSYRGARGNRNGCGRWG